VALLRTTGWCTAGLFLLGLVPFVLVWQPDSNTMAKALLPSVAVLSKLTATTFEGAAVPSQSLYTPNGAVFFMIRRMG